MPKLQGARPVQGCVRELPPARQRPSRAEDELSEEAIRALEEGHAGHGASCTFTPAAIKRELRIAS